MVADSDETSGTGEQRAGEPEVISTLVGQVATVVVEGELTEAARRPLVRVLTDLLLSGADLQRVELDLRAVSFTNSAGLAVLVQLQRLADPRGIELRLVAPTPAVAKPLQLAGLWRRFVISEE